MISDPMQRRTFITLLGGAAAAWPLAARAQRSRMPVIGILCSGTAETHSPRLIYFLQGLKEIGFVEGQNVAIEYRWADDQYDRLPAMAAELVRARVSLIAAISTNLPTRAAKGATTTIPIVFNMGADPVALGLVDGLSRPGGNITGVTTLAADQIQKRLQLLHDAVPAAKVFGLIINPDNFGRTSSAARTPLELSQEAVRAWGGTLHVAQARAIGEFDAAVASLVEKRIDALATQSDALFSSGRERLIALAAQYAVPMILPGAGGAKAGALMGYSASDSYSMRDTGRYTGRILKGEKPADLPVVQPTKFEFVVNLKTAKTLGLTIPPGLLAIVDEVIE
jgi:putative ABC transport system substrate-binding protein